jgi:hypothetical protein
MEEEMNAASGTPEQGARPSGGSSALVPGTRWRRVFPGEERRLSLLRRWLESLLPDCPARDDVACVATELGTNAVRHTASHGGWFALEITWCESAVRVAVADGGAPGAPRVIDDPAAEQGRGLLVVEGLSVRSGVLGDHRGRIVWADIPWGDAGAATPGSSQDTCEAVIRDGHPPRTDVTGPVRAGVTAHVRRLEFRAGRPGLAGALARSVDRTRQ